MALFRSPASEYPRLVAVETTSHCNAYCIFCPNNALARNKGSMDDDLFKKIIDDCTAFPLPAIEPFLQGEPFSDPHIIPRLEHIRRRLPKTKLRLYTNGYGMTPKRIDQLLDLGIDHLYVSLNTLDPEKYRKLMGIRLKRTLHNIDYLTSGSRRCRVADKVTFRMTRLGDTTLKEQDEFLAYCKERRVQAIIVGLFNYKGDIHSALEVPSYGCEHVHRLDILATGKVTLCCMDQEGEHGWGDARNHSVLELYQHQRARKYRRMHATGKRRKIAPCGTCNNFWPGFYGLAPLAKLRTALEYCSYVLRHRPSGRRAPAPYGESDTLAQLRAHRKWAGESGAGAGD